MVGRSLLLLGLTLLACEASWSADDAMSGEASRDGAARAVARALWIDRDRLTVLPMEGAAWDALVAASRAETRRPDLSDQDDPTNVRVFAKALVAARTGDDALAGAVRQALARVRGTERDANALAVARELSSYVLAADLVGLDGPERVEFEAWLRGLRERHFEGRTLRSTHEDRPNNWGTHAGASRLAVALYLGDAAEVRRAAHVFRGWTGERDGWRGFAFGSGAWQAGFFRRYAVNPAGATRRGHPIGGVLPDDQRRGGGFRWPPPRENYVYEALQGAAVQALLLERAGHDAWCWGDRALLRAFRWLHDVADYPAEGDDTWLPHLVNHVYGTRFPAPIPSRPGKALGFTDWTHAGPRPRACPVER